MQPQLCLEVDHSGKGWVLARCLALMPGVPFAPCGILLASKPRAPHLSHPLAFFPLPFKLASVLAEVDLGK